MNDANFLAVNLFLGGNNDIETLVLLAAQVKFRQAERHCKTVSKAAKPAYAYKTKETITSQKLGPREFW